MTNYKKLIDQISKADNCKEIKERVKALSDEELDKANMAAIAKLEDIDEEVEGVSLRDLIQERYQQVEAITWDELVERGIYV